MPDGVDAGCVQGDVKGVALSVDYSGAMSRGSWLSAIRVMCVVLALAGCAPRGAAPRFEAASPGVSGGKLRVTFLDVGQGDAALIQAPGGEALLIDGEPSQAGGDVAAALGAAGISRISLMVGSHPHEDHIGGLIRVLQSVPVERALDPGYAHGSTTQRTYLRLLKGKGVKTTRARAGQVHALGPTVRLEVLAPADPLFEDTEADANNNSIVARLVYGGTRFLFTGDMETAERERLLASTDPERLRSDVLKVAHHGSHNGTDEAFLRAVRPKYAVMSLAKGNDYGHPHQETLDELRSLGIPTLRTDERGSVRFTSDGAKIELLGPLPGRPAAPGTSSRAAGAVIGNRASKVYHAPGCGALPARSRRVTLKNAGAAEVEGYRPHASCVGERGGPR